MEPRPSTQRESFSTKLSSCSSLYEISASFFAFFSPLLLANALVVRQISSCHFHHHYCPSRRQNRQGVGPRGQCRGEEGRGQERPGELGQRFGTRPLTHEGCVQPDRERERERERVREREGGGREQNFRITTNSAYQIKNRYSADDCVLANAHNNY